MKPVAIAGAGISGLTAAFYLRQRGIPVVVYEASGRCGGMIQTTTRGGFLSESGPNTIMTNSAAVPALIRDLDLESRRLLPTSSGSIRYIVRDGEPVRVPDSPLGAIGTRLLSAGAKLRVLGEPFIARGSSNDESLSGFVRRRLGQEFLDYLIDPFVAGVYAGDPDQLSAAHAFPRMAGLEQRYGSLIKGAVLGAKERRERDAPIHGEPRMFSLDRGLAVLPATLQERLNGSVLLNCPVEGIEKTEDGWQVQSPAGSETYSSVLLCSPAHQLSSLRAAGDLFEDLKGFEQVYYPPIARIAFGFRRSQIAHSLAGFGALVPRRERMSILGVLFSSSMFPNRAPEGHVLLTVFAGGARNPGLPRLHDSEIARAALEDLRRLLGIKGQPVYTDVLKLDRSIPQYNVGYRGVKNLIERVESRSPGLFVASSCSHGISVSDCITGGAAAAGRVAGYRSA
jgi:oxygen-dependent protoporphyrinogen oxidase